MKPNCNWDLGSIPLKQEVGKQQMQFNTEHSY